jgi:hypothetical protein
MQKIVGIVAASALVLLAHAASADEVTGTVSSIDLTANTFMVDGKTYAASPTNTVGAKLSDLEEGDTVKVEFATQDVLDGKQPINAMALEKVE